MAATPNPTIAEYIEKGLTARLRRANVKGHFKVSQDSDDLLIECFRPGRTHRIPKHRFKLDQYPDLDQLLERIMVAEDWS